jgi:hypothetical protein
VHGEYRHLKVSMAETEASIKYMMQHCSNESSFAITPESGTEVVLPGAPRCPPTAFVCTHCFRLPQCTPVCVCVCVCVRAGALVLAYNIMSVISSTLNRPAGRAGGQ